MRWTRLGRIFDPRDHALPPGCFGFAQSPQVLDCGRFLRIFFSTRSRDASGGKFVSQVSFVDMSRDLREVLGSSRTTVLPTGGLGCYDEHGIFPFHVMRHQGQVLGFISGWSRRVSVSVETAIGLAVSKDDGLSFQRIGPGPVLGPSLREPCLVGDPFVLHHGGRFHMWYIFGTGWARDTPAGIPERTYKIAHAHSEDGIRWERRDGHALIPDRLGDGECQALPSVVEIDGRFHMFFCFRERFGFREDPARAYRIGHAWSDDLIGWTRTEGIPGLAAEPGDWDADMQCYPHAFRCDGQIYLLYNGNAFGRDGFGAARLER